MASAFDCFILRLKSGLSVHRAIELTHKASRQARELLGYQRADTLNPLAECWGQNGHRYAAGQLFPDVMVQPTGRSFKRIPMCGEVGATS